MATIISRRDFLSSAALTALTIGLPNTLYDEASLFSNTSNENLRVGYLSHIEPQLKLILDSCPISLNMVRLSSSDFQLDVLRDYFISGKIDVFLGLGHSLHNVITKHSLFDGVSSGLTTQQFEHWYLNGGLKLWQKHLADRDFLHLGYWARAPFYGIWFRNPVTDVIDLNDLRFSGSPTTTAAINSIRNIQLKSPTFTGKNLSDLKQLDAVEWLNPATDMLYFLQNEFRYYYSVHQASRKTSSSANYEFISTPNALVSPQKLQLFSSWIQTQRAKVLLEFAAADSLALQQLSQQGTQISALPTEIKNKLLAAHLDTMHSKQIQNGLC